MTFCSQVRGCGTGLAEAARVTNVEEASQFSRSAFEQHGRTRT
jgi:hypothetical protein